MSASRPIGAIAATIAGAALLSAVTGLPAWADSAPEGVRIRFSAPQGCPDSSAFMRALSQRTGRFRRAGDLEDARTFIATITRDDSAFTGHLTTQLPGKASSERSVTGKTCDDVVTVLAFMTALAIDPSAPPRGSQTARPISSRPPVPAPAEATERALAPALAEPSTPERPAAHAAPPSPAPPAPRVAEVPANPRARTQDAPAREFPATEASPAGIASGTDQPPRWRWSAGVAGEASLGLWPTAGWGGLLFVEAAAPGRSRLGPVLRAGVSLNQSRDRLSEGAEARYQLAALVLEGCPLRLLFLDSALAAHACLDVHVGALRAKGRGLDRAAKTTEAWLDLGPLARVRVAISKRLFVEGQGMLVVPLRRLAYDVYYAGPAAAATTVHTVPRLGALVGIGMGYQFR